MPAPLTLPAEAELFSRYLIGRPCGPELAARYGRACERHRLDGADDVILRACAGGPFRTALLDAACALKRPQHPLRRKLILMTAILETAPEHAHLFLPRPFGAGGWARLAWSGLKAVALALLGVWWLRRLEGRR